MNIYESGENYLETIYLLTMSKGNVRAIDVSTALNYSKPSVSRALQILKKAEFISINSDGLISLTDKGVTLVTATLERHNNIKAYLVSIGLPEDIADKDACRIEHVISPETYALFCDKVNIR